MCAIAGQLNFAAEQPVDLVRIERMKQSMFHRGPDDHGTYADGPLAFGFRRLSIIDLSGGHQPMTDTENSVCVVFNGEIYNFRELRRDLESRGCVFRTKSDTEVIVHGYKTWGDQVLQRLNGMFGFAVWDRRARRLLVARDRAGIKLVYYKISDGCLTFASEARAILAADQSRPELDLTALQLFLRFRYTPSPYTLFSGIKKLAPGSAMVVENGESRIFRYWKFTPKQSQPVPRIEDAEEQLLSLYRAAVKRQLVSDVPLGVLLSGGLDSALLLALTKSEGGTRKSFTVGYGAESDPDDELADAQRTAAALGIPHYQTRIDQKAFDHILPSVIHTLEEPVATASIVPMHFVCERARQDVTVALVGQGPDELFCGYQRHLGLKLGLLWRKLPRHIRSLSKAALRNSSRSEALRRGLDSLDAKSTLHRYKEVFSLMPGAELDSLFNDGVVSTNPEEEIERCWGDLIPALSDLPELSGFNYLEVNSTLPDELLMYSDKISMHHSLELRVPYLDQEIIEYSIGLPDTFKVHGLERKWLHRRVCRKFLPNEVLRRPKRGFACRMVDHWFRASMGGRVSDLLMDPHSLMFQYLSRTRIGNLLEAHRQGRTDNHKILFSLVFVEEWLRNFMNPSVSSDVMVPALAATA